jgi:3-oxoadipate enol-lactonase
MPFARLNDAVIHYADEGPRDAPALVFANSLGTDFRIWDGVVAALVGRFRIVRADKRGHGLSSLPAGAPLMGEYAKDVVGLMNALGVARATLVGVSMGGVIAQELHRLHPSRVGALVLMDTAAKIGTDETWDSRMAAVREGGIAAIAEPILQRWFSANFRAQRADEFEGYRAMLVRQPVDGYLAACGALKAADLRNHAPKIDVPTLCLVGDEDGSTPPPLVEATAKLIPHARFEVIAGAGHLPSIERPDFVASLIEEHSRRAT